MDINLNAALLEGTADHESTAFASADLDDSSWLEVPVPSDVHTALMEAGRLPDPRYGFNEARIGWVAARTWWYRFHLGPAPEATADDRDEIVFEGLDTFATIYVNGVEVAEHRNMFLPCVIDAAGLLRPDQDNVVAVRLSPPELWAADPATPAERSGAENGAVHEENPFPWSGVRVRSRKSQYSWGWNFAPVLPQIGIWKPVRHVRRPIPRIGVVSFSTVDLDRDGDTAICKVGVILEAHSAASAPRYRVELRSRDGEVVVSTDGRFARGTDRAIAGLNVDEPELWWTHDLGEPYLYDLEVSLWSDDDVLTDDWHGRVGIRTIDLDESPNPDEPGTRYFRFVLNGVPIFAKGANWVPLDMRTAAITEERYTRAVELVRDAGMMMLRVNGVGVYESDVFYDLCDRLGILVWQDFCLNNGVYPVTDREWLQSFEQEARYQIGRLSHRASLALWCGNNEIDMAWEIVRGGVYKSLTAPPAEVSDAQELYYELLPRLLAELDGSRTYVPTSPIFQSDQTQGNTHNWKVWMAFPRNFLDPGDEYMIDSLAFGATVDPRSDEAVRFAEAASPAQYLADESRFVSEMGIAALPHLHTLRRWVPEEGLALGSDHLLHRLRDRQPWENKFDVLLEYEVGQPSDIAEYVHMSQFMQAEGLKTGIEHYRRRSPNTAGALIWQFDDVWPGTTWSIIDYDLRPKAAWYAARRFNAPILASFCRTDDGSLELWLANQTLEPIRARLRAKLARFDGGVDWEEAVSASVGPGSSERVATWPRDRVDLGADRYAHVGDPAGRIGDNRLPMQPWRTADREQPDLRVEPRAVADGVHLAITPDRFALGVQVSCDDPNVQFSDNFFDIEAGYTATVTVWGVDDPERVSVASL